jgi:protein tyrosine/serine phosphatase
MANQFGIGHYEFDLSPYREASEDDLKAIIDIIRDAPKPILVHCKSGADRTEIEKAIHKACL